MAAGMYYDDDWCGNGRIPIPFPPNRVFDARVLTTNPALLLPAVQQFGAGVQGGVAG